MGKHDQESGVLLGNDEPLREGSISPKTDEKRFLSLIDEPMHVLLLGEVDSFSQGVCKHSLKDPIVQDLFPDAGRLLFENYELLKNNLRLEMEKKDISSIEFLKTLQNLKQHQALIEGILEKVEQKERSITKLHEYADKRIDDQIKNLEKEVEKIDSDLTLIREGRTFLNQKLEKNKSKIEALIVQKSEAETDEEKLIFDNEIGRLKESTKALEIDNTKKILELTKNIEEGNQKITPLKLQIAELKQKRVKAIQISSLFNEKMKSPKTVKQKFSSELDATKKLIDIIEENAMQTLLKGLTSIKNSDSEKVFKELYQAIGNFESEEDTSLSTILASYGVSNSRVRTLFPFEIEIKLDLIKRAISAADGVYHVLKNEEKKEGKSEGKTPEEINKAMKTVFEKTQQFIAQVIENKDLTNKEKFNEFVEKSFFGYEKVKKHFFSFEETRFLDDAFLQSLSKTLLAKTKSSESVVERLAAGERLANFERRSETPITTVTEKNGFKIIQIDEPLVAVLTDDQKTEWDNIKLSPENQPHWFKQLLKMEQAWCLANIDKIKNGEFVSPPTTLRTIPGLANFTKHICLIVKDGKVISEHETIRRATFAPVHIEDDVERKRFAEQNAQQLENALEVEGIFKGYWNPKFIQEYNSLVRDESQTAFRKLKAIHLDQNLLSPLEFMEDLHVYYDSFKKDKKKLTPLYIVRNLFSPLGFLEDLRAYEKGDKENHNALILSDATTAINFAKHSDQVLILTNNWSVNSERRFKSGFGNEDTKRTKTALLNSICDFTNAILKNVIPTTKLNSEDREQILSVFHLTFGEHPESIRQFNSEGMRKLVVLLRENQSAIFQDVFSENNTEKNTAKFLHALEAAADYHEMWEHAERGVGGLLRIEKFSDLNYQNAHLFAAALEDIIVNGLGGLLSGGCKSAKDRKGTELVMLDAMLAYREIYGKFPKYSDTGIDRENFVEIYANLYCAGHHQAVADDNAKGVAGCLNEGHATRVQEGMLPEDIINAIQAKDAHRLSIQDKLGKLNKLEKLKIQAKVGKSNKGEKLKMNEQMEVLEKSQDILQEKVEIIPAKDYPADIVSAPQSSIDMQLLSREFFAKLEKLDFRSSAHLDANVRAVLADCGRLSAQLQMSKRKNTPMGGDDFTPLWEEIFSNMVKKEHVDKLKLIDAYSEKNQLELELDLADSCQRFYHIYTASTKCYDNESKIIEVRTKEQLMNALKEHSVVYREVGDRIQLVSTGITKAGLIAGTNIRIDKTANVQKIIEAQISEAVQLPIGSQSSPVKEEKFIDTIEVLRKEDEDLDQNMTADSDRLMNNYKFLGVKAGGANSPGVLGGRYTRGDKIVLFKQDTDKTGKIHHDKNIAEVVSGMLLKKLIGDSAATVFFARQSDSQKIPDETGENIYVGSTFYKDYCDLFKHKDVRPERSESISKLRKLFRIEDEEGRPRFVGTFNNEPYRTAMLSGQFTNFETVMAPSLLTRDFDVHVGNVGVVQSKDEKTGKLVRIDFAGALDDLEDWLEPHSISEHLPGQGPTNHFREYPRVLRVSPLMAAEYNRIGNFDKREFEKTIDEAINEAAKYYGAEPLADFAERMGVKDIRSEKYKTAGKLDKDKVVDGAKVFLKDKMAKRMRSMRELALEIAIDLCIAKTAGNRFYLTDAIDELILKNPEYFLRGEFHFREGEHQPDYFDIDLIATAYGDDISKESDKSKYARRSDLAGLLKERTKAVLEGKNKTSPKSSEVSSRRNKNADLEFSDISAEIYNATVLRLKSEVECIEKIYKSLSDKEKIPYAKLLMAKSLDEIEKFPTALDQKLQRFALSMQFIKQAEKLDSLREVAAKLSEETNLLEKIESLRTDTQKLLTEESRKEESVSIKERVSIKLSDDKTKPSPTSEKEQKSFFASFRNPFNAVAKLRSALWFNENLPFLKSHKDVIDSLKTFKDTMPKEELPRGFGLALPAICNYVERFLEGREVVTESDDELCQALLNSLPDPKSLEALNAIPQNNENHSELNEAMLSRYKQKYEQISKYKDLRKQVETKVTENKAAQITVEKPTTDSQETTEQSKVVSSLASATTDDLSAFAKETHQDGRTIVTPKNAEGLFYSKEDGNQTKSYDRQHGKPLGLFDRIKGYAENEKRLVEVMAIDHVKSGNKVAVIGCNWDRAKDVNLCMKTAIAIRALNPSMEITMKNTKQGSSTQQSFEQFIKTDYSKNFFQTHGGIFKGSREKILQNLIDDRKVAFIKDDVITEEGKFTQEDKTQPRVTIESKNPQEILPSLIEPGSNNSSLHR